MPPNQTPPSSKHLLVNQENQHTKYKPRITTKPKSNKNQSSHRLSPITAIFYAGIILLSSFQQIIALYVNSPASTHGTTSVSPIETPSTAVVVRKLGVITVATEDLLTAYDSAIAGDTIELQGGTVFQPASTVSDEAAIEIEKPVSIQCLDLVNKCELNGLDARRVIYISTGTSEATSLIRLLITKGRRVVRINF